MGHVAQRRLHAADASVLLVRGRAQALPFADQTFPFVLITFPAEFAVDLLTAGELWRIMQPEGMVVIIVTAQVVGGSGLGLWVGGLLAMVRHARPWYTQIESVYAAAGFSVSIQSVPLPQSRVTVALARRQTATQLNGHIDPG